MNLWNTCKFWTDIQGRSQNLCHFDPGMGLKLGYSGFSRNQNNPGSSGAYVTCIYCGLRVKIKHASKCGSTSKDRGRICFWVCGQQNLKTPNMSPMADDTVTRGSILGLGSPLYTCEVLECFSPMQSSTFWEKKNNLSAINLTKFYQHIYIKNVKFMTSSPSIP